MRGAAAALAALLVLPVAAAPAVADDEVEIDERLVSSGYTDAWTDYLPADVPAGEGVHVVLDYDSSSASAAAFAAEADRAAGLVWQHLEMRVLSVLVAPTNGVAWRDGQQPPPAMFSRDALERAHGPRASGLDSGGAGFYGTGSEVAFGVGALVVVVVLVAGAATGGYFWGRTNGRRSAGQQSWPSGPPSWGSTWGPAAPAPGGWPPAPPAGGWPPAPPAGGWPPPAGPDPWRPS